MHLLQCKYYTDVSTKLLDHFCVESKFCKPLLPQLSQQDYSMSMSVWTA